MPGGGTTQPRVDYVRSHGAHIAYRVFGDGAVNLLWYPGAPLLPMESVDEEPALTRFRDRLASFCRIIQFDPCGIGLSDPWPAGTAPTLEQWVDDALAVLDAVGCGQVAVIAPRDATLEAVMLAATHPERVARLVVVNGFARFRRDADYPVGIPDRLVDRYLETGLEPPPADAGSAAGIDILSIVGPSVAADAAFRSWWDRAGRHGASPATARATLSVLYQADVRPLLPLVQAPTLVLHRRDAQNFRVGHGRYLAEHVPHATYVELPGNDCLYWVGDTDSMLDEIEEFLTGSRRGPNADRVLAAVLFTDIVDSTRKLAELGERRWRETLDRHDEAVRRHLQRFRGRAVKSTGDGVLATFDGPARAVLCAAAIRDALHELGLSTRTGIHVGEVEVRGDDISGMAVHIAARVLGLAGPDEILVSRTLVDLVIGSGIEVTSAGEHELKGVPGTVALFAVTAVPA